MAFQLLLAPRSNDQISDLRRQEAAQPAHALDFAYLIGDAVFELLVELRKLLRLPCKLLGFFAKFAQQPRVLDSYYSLGSKVRHKSYLFVGKRTDLLSKQSKYADWFVL